eukprot:TRINITY_DN30438_c0_g1_i1.p1 TRINITY_DN30438_c0_g1~~TRINITY_DN30438_c0_g1_i1.p1  ORF type:complete len:270 (-),score=50.23 TRINITY_DN30438_c0_g1_i1:161-922(-)
MGQNETRLCRTQEIGWAHPSSEKEASEWQAGDEFAEDPATVPARLSHLGEPSGTPLNCQPCCAPPDSKAEEVLVVHHHALKRIDLLLKLDELQACETPGVPECVAAVRRAKIQRRLLQQRGLDAGGPLSTWPPTMPRADVADDDPDGGAITDPSDGEFTDPEPSSFAAAASGISGVYRGVAPGDELPNGAEVGGLSLPSSGVGVGSHLPAPSRLGASSPRRSHPSGAGHSAELPAAAATAGVQRDGSELQVGC